jgi:hypothetical protein
VGCDRVHEPEPAVGDVAREFFCEVVKQAQQRLISDEHFTVDGTLIESGESKELPAER